MSKTLLTLTLSLAAASALAAPHVIELSHGGAPGQRMEIPGATLVDNTMRQATDETRNLLRAPGNNLWIDWSFSADPYNVLPNQAGEIKIAFKFEGWTSGMFAGDQLTGVSFYSPYSTSYPDYNIQRYTQPVTEATVWLSETLEGEPFATQTGAISNLSMGFNTLYFDTPLDLTEGKEFFIGVTFNIEGTYADKVSAFYVDGYQGTGNSSWVYSTLKAYNRNTGDFEFYTEPQWSEWGSTFGGACMYAHLEGENFLQNQVGLYGTVLPGTVGTDQVFKFNTGFQNMGANGITSLEYTFEMEGQAPQTLTVESGTPIYYGEYASAPLEFSSELNQYGAPWKLYVSKINGDSPNLFDYDNTMYRFATMYNIEEEGTIHVVKDGYASHPLAEEFTGTGCGWCPRGIVGMEYMAKNYADQGFIGIAVHNSWFGTDPMSVMDKATDAYYKVGSNVSGLPSAVFNRHFNDIINPSSEELEAAFLDLIQYPSIAAISTVASVLDEDGVKKLSFDATAEFAYDLENAGFVIGQTVIENKVGPYAQTNYYAKAYGTGEKLEGWDDKGATVPTIYNDVARNCSKPNGYNKSVPTSITKGEKYTYSKTFKLDGVKDVANCLLVTYVVDTATGEIVNACMVDPNDSSAVSAVEGETAFVARGEAGALVLGQASDVYTIDGRTVARAAEGRVALPAGVYIVNAQGRTAKVMVR